MFGRWVNKGMGIYTSACLAFPLAADPKVEDGDWLFPLFCKHRVVCFLIYIDLHFWNKYMSLFQE